MSLRLRFAPFLLLTASHAYADSPAPPPGPQQLLYVTEGNRLRRFDVDTLNGPRLLEDVLVRNASEDAAGLATGTGRDVNGIVCPLPDGSGRFVAGEDTGQTAVPPGWGIFSSDGTQLGKLAAPAFVPQPEPNGCAVDAEGRLFTTELGSEAGFSGQLILWFPPFEGFPGSPGSYPNGAFSTNFCKLATGIGAATGIAIDDAGRVLVASPRIGQVLRFSGEFPTGPDAAGGCGRSDDGTPPSPLVDAGRLRVETFISGFPTASGIARGPNGHWFVSSVLFGRIAEFDADGSFVRTVMEPAEPPVALPLSTGHPQSLAFDARGNLYYVDLDLRGNLLFPETGPNGSLRRIRFDAAGNPLPPELLRDGLRFPDGVVVLPGDLEPSEWRSYGGGARRLFFNPRETTITRHNVARLATRWEFPTGAIVTASPSVALVDLPGEGPTQVVYFQAWDDHVYALRLDDATEVWRFRSATQPGAAFPNAASVDVGESDGRDRVWIGAGEILYALDAVTGRELWRFVAGTGCVDAAGQPPGLCAFDGERNQIESSVLAAGGRLFFGMDVNDNVNGTGGFYALDARTGQLDWFFDVESGATCRPAPGDAITRFDGYHSEAELGLPPGFSASRPGCGFPRRRSGCGNVWSSASFDAGRGLLFVASSNCDTDADPATPEPTLSDPPSMPPFDEALLALDTEGRVAWRWRPREFDNDDLAFGAAPNLFAIQGPEGPIDVVGIGNKDGSYYVLDRDGVNEQSGVAWNDPDPAQLPYWRRNVVPGGEIGGIVASASADEVERRIYFSTAPGFDAVRPQQPTMHALDMDSGEIVWQNTGAAGPDAFASFSPTMGIPGVAFTGSVPLPQLRGFDTASGALLLRSLVGSSVNLLFSAVASAATTVDGTLLVGTGIGTRSTRPEGDFASRLPSPLVALCVPGTRGCGACQDGRDNDGDGLADAPADPGCLDSRDPTETPNARPAAEAGPDAAVECDSPAGATLVLDGGASSDPDGDPLGYAWHAAAGEAAGVRPAFELPLGSQLVTLVVADGQGLTDFDSVAARVRDTAPPGLEASLEVVDPAAQGKGREKLQADRAAKQKQATAMQGKAKHAKAKQAKHVSRGKRLFRVELGCNDVCDPAPRVAASLGGTPVADGDLIRARPGALRLEVRCTDASGNAASVSVAPGSAASR